MIDATIQFCKFVIFGDNYHCIDQTSYPELLHRPEELSSEHTCQICLWKLVKSRTLNWGHSFWKSWIQNYLKSKITRCMLFDICCPISECNIQIRQNIIFQLCSKQMKIKYRENYKNLKLIQDSMKYMFCLGWNSLLKIK